MNPNFQPISDFVKSVPNDGWGHSTWVKHEGVYELYIRVCENVVDDTRVRCLVVSNVAVVPTRRKKRVYHRMLAYMEQLAVEHDIPCMYIENVHSAAHHGIYTRRGYTVKDSDVRFLVTDLQEKVKMELKIAIGGEKSFDLLLPVCFYKLLK